MNKIVLKQNDVQEDVLAEFITALENATGCHVTMEASYELSVDDEKSAAILQTVFGGNGTKPVVKPKAQKEKKPRKKGYKVLDGEFAGQEFTGASIAKMLKTGKIRIGANLIHSRKGRFQVNMNLNGKYVLLPIGEPA